MLTMSHRERTGFETRRLYVARARTERRRDPYGKRVCVTLATPLQTRELGTRVQPGAARTCKELLGRGQRKSSGCLAVPEAADSGSAIIPELARERRASGYGEGEDPT